jgi:hypothetical protein
MTDGRAAADPLGRGCARFLLVPAFLIAWFFALMLTGVGLSDCPAGGWYLRIAQTGLVMLVLVPVGGVACVWGSPASLRLSIRLGVVAAAVTVWVAFAAVQAGLNACGGTTDELDEWVGWLGVMVGIAGVPAVVQLGGTWLMRRAIRNDANRGEPAADGTGT